MKKIAVFLAALVALAVPAFGQQYYNISPKYIFEHQVMDSTHVGVVSTDTIWFNKTAATKDVNLYRASANRLKTDDSLTVAGNATFSGTSTHTGVASFANGTAALPAVAGINDPNTGIRFPTNDTLAVSTGGVERLRVDPSGNVGIGTTGPTTKLEVFGTVGNPPSSGTATVGMATFSTSNNNNLYLGAVSGSPYGFWLQVQDATNLATNYPLLLNPNGGNVGIGTITPDKLLGLSDGTDEYSLSVASDKLTFWNDAGTPVALAVIDSSGNVGIGTTGPLEALSLNRVSGNNVIGFQTNGTTRAYMGVSNSNDGVNTGSIVGDLMFRSANTSIMFSVNDGTSSALYIKSTGNVGIGTTTPSTAGKLSVAGGVTIGVATTDTVLNAHHLRINNAGTFSEIVAGETAFDNVSDINVKQNIQPVDTDSIYSLVKAMNYPRKWQYKPSILRTQAEIDRINEATSDKTVTPLVEAKVDSLVKAKATGTFSVTTTQVPVVSYKKAIASIEPSHVRVGLDSLDEAIVIPADTTYKDVPETTYVARYDTVYTCSASKRTQIWNAVLASQQAKATSELAAYEARVAKDAAIPHVSVMAQDMYPISKLMKGDEAKETVLSGDNLINALLIAVKKQAEQIAKLEARVTALETK